MNVIYASSLLYPVQFANWQTAIKLHRWYYLPSIIFKVTSHGTGATEAAVVWIGYLSEVTHERFIKNFELCSIDH